MTIGTYDKKSISINNYQSGGIMKKSNLFILILTLLCFWTLTASEPTTPDIGSFSKDHSGIFFDNASNQYFINDKIAFSIRPTSDEKHLDKIKFSIDNGPYSEYSGKIKFEKDGFHIVRFKAVDPVLNWSPIQNFRIYVDLTQPKSSANWQGETFSNGQDFFVNKNAELILSAQDNLAGVAKILWIENNQNIIKEYKSRQKFQEGAYDLKIASIDNVGNVEPWKNVSFKVDGEAPKSTASITGNSFTSNNKLFIDKGTFVTLKADDNSSGIAKTEYRINEEASAIYNQKISINESVTKIQYRSIDNVGNAESWQTMTVYLDSTPPELKVKNSGKFQEVAGKIFARAGLHVIASVDDKDSGANMLLVNNEKNDKTSQKDLVFAEPGEHDLFLSAEDNVGNASNSISYSIFVDEKAPESKLESATAFIEKDGGYISSLPNKLTFAATDHGVGVDFIEMSYDNKTFQKISDTIDLATWETPRRTIYYRAHDKLGNIEETKQMSIYVRKHGPNVDLFVEKEDLPAVSLSDLIKIKGSKEKEEKAARVPAQKNKAEE